MEQFKRSFLTVLVLSVLHEGKEMYGYEIAQTVKQRTNGRYDLQEGVLYPLLYHFEKSGIVKGEWRANPHGRDRKYFWLTPKGQKLLEKETKGWRELISLVPELAGASGGQK